MVLGCRRRRVRKHVHHSVDLKRVSRVCLMEAPCLSFADTAANAHTLNLRKQRYPASCGKSSAGTHSTRTNVCVLWKFVPHLQVWISDACVKRERERERERMREPHIQREERERQRGKDRLRRDICDGNLFSFSLLVVSEWPHKSVEQKYFRYFAPTTTIHWGTAFHRSCWKRYEQTQTSLQSQEQGCFKNIYFRSQSCEPEFSRYRVKLLESNSTTTACQQTVFVQTSLHIAKVSTTGVFFRYELRCRTHRECGFISFHPAFRVIETRGTQDADRTNGRSIWQQITGRLVHDWCLIREVEWASTQKEESHFKPLSRESFILARHM